MTAVVSQENGQNDGRMAATARRGDWGKAARRGARGGAAAEGPPPPLWGPGGEGGGAPRGAWGGGGGGKPQKTAQSPDIQYKDPTDYTKPPKDYTKPLNIRQNHNILNKYLNYLQ